MNINQNSIIELLILIVLVSCKAQTNKDTKPIAISTDQNIMVRIAEIEIHPEYLEEYIAILNDEAEASVRLEAGVICIYPMFEKENPTQIRLLEIYADSTAYQYHLQTPHFKHYKTTTLPMVKSLKLIDMQAIDPNSMEKIFEKLADY